jgi:hypothetical protein
MGNHISYQEDRMKKTFVVRLTAIVRVLFCSAAALILQSGWAASKSDSVATLRRYEVEPTADGVLGVLRQWRPDTENRARIAQLVRDLGDNNWAVRDRASRQLAGMGRLAEPALRDATSSNDAEVVHRARSLLAECRSGRAEELLAAALEWLRQSPTPQATALLLDLLPVLPDEFHSSTREALWVCAVPGDAPRLRQAIGDARPVVREAAIVALERAAGAGAVRDLEPLLRDKNEATRLAAARALLDRLPRTAIAALVGLLDSREPDIRRQAAWLLQQVSGIAQPDETPAGLAEAAVRWKAWAATESAGHPPPLGLNRLYCYAPKAASFDGKSSVAANAIDLDTSRDWSLAFWIYASDRPTDDPGPAVASISTGSCDSNPQVNFNAAVRGFFVVSACGAPNYVKIGPSADFAGQWKHVVIASGGRTTRTFVNGVEAGSGAIAWHASTKQTLTLAANEPQRNDQLRQYFHGRLQEVQLYDIALNSAQAGYLFNHGTAYRGVPPQIGVEHLLAGYHLDGDTADFSGKGHRGTWTGTPDYAAGAIAHTRPISKSPPEK